jgi:SagB-type dehydrogenase family enzyme
MTGGVMQLPEPHIDGPVSLEQAIALRRSIRSFSADPLNLDELSQLLWAAQGASTTGGFRTAPSAGASYPLETYVVAGNVEGLEPGLYHYEQSRHELTPKAMGDLRAELSDNSLGQSCVRDAAAVFVFAGIYERTTERYGDRGTMYVHMDVGHAAQNVLLQATAIGLGAVPVGAFKTRTVRAQLGLDENEVPLYLIPVGRVS